MIFLYALIAVIPLENAPLLAQLPGIGSLPKIVGAFCMLAAFAQVAMTQRVPGLLRTAQGKLMLVLLVSATVSGIASGHILELGVNNVSSYFSLFCFVLVVMVLVNSERRMYWMFVVLVVFMSWACSYGIREYIWGVRHYGVEWRPNGVTGDANYFGVNCLLTLPVAILLFLRSRKHFKRLFFLGCIGLIIGELLVGASRGAFIGATAMFLFFVSQSRHKVRYLAIATFLVIPFLLLSPTSPLKRLVLGSHGDVGAAESRLLTWKAGLRMMARHPLMGVGLDTFKQIEVYYDPTGLLKFHPHIAHNAYVEVGAELGIPTLLVFVGILFFTLRTLGKARRQALRQDETFLAQCALAMHTGLVGASVAIFFVSGQYMKLLWLFFGLTLCVPALVAKAIRRKNAEASAPAEETTHEQAEEALPIFG